MITCKHLFDSVIYAVPTTVRRREWSDRELRHDRYSYFSSSRCSLNVECLARPLTFMVSIFSSDPFTLSFSWLDLPRTFPPRATLALTAETAVSSASHASGLAADLVDQSGETNCDRDHA